MKRISFFILCSLLWSSNILFSQTLSQIWLRTDTVGYANLSNYFEIEKGSRDITRSVFSWMDNLNMVHAPSVTRIDYNSNTVFDSLFNNNSYADYRINTIFTQNGITYYYGDFQSNYIFFQKMDHNGNILWNQTVPRGRHFFANDWNFKKASKCIDDSLNNRLLWPYEQFDASFTIKSMGILATDKTTGAISIIDTICRTGVSSNYLFAFELAEDNAGHRYISYQDSFKVVISSFHNGTITPEAIIDSSVFRGYPQSMRIVGNTMFISYQMENTMNSGRTGHLKVYQIDAAGHLTLLKSYNYGDDTQYIVAPKTFGNNYYLFGFNRNMLNNWSLIPFIHTFDLGGNCIDTILIPPFTGYNIGDIAISQHGLYVVLNTSASMQIILYPHGSQNPIINQNLNVFDGRTFQMEIAESNATSDVLIIAGNPFNSETQIGKYAVTGFTGIALHEKTNPIAIYPNPGSEFIRIKGIQDAEIKIYNSNGLFVQEHKLNHAEENLSIKDLPNGMYLLQIKSGNELFTVNFFKGD